MWVYQSLNNQGKLNLNEQFFFKKTKPAEELYDLVNDPYEMNNLVNNQRYSKILVQLREKTKQYEKEMKPMSDSYEPVNPISVGVLEFVKKKHPKEYEKMLDGEEIGFKTYVNLYKKEKKVSIDKNKLNGN